MAQDLDQERTEPATPKRRREARQKGQVARSREVPSVMVLITGLAVLKFWAEPMYEQMTVMMKSLFDLSVMMKINQGGITPFLIELIVGGFRLLLPLLVLTIVAAFLGNCLQVGFMASFEAIQPRFSKIDPVTGLKRLVSKHSLAELVKGILKISIITLVAYLTVRSEFHRVFPLIQTDPGSILITITSISFKICSRTAWVLIALAILDYGFNRWEYERSLRMTKQEVKDEYKQREGDPLIKSRIRNIQREMARKRMMAAVPKADVVITNPTEIAVALEYRRERMHAPEVSAKGSGHLARKIKAVAAEHGVPVIEDKPLAQTLYKSVEIGEQIPPNLYRAVAEVLAYIYRLKGRAL